MPREITHKLYVYTVKSLDDLTYVNDFDSSGSVIFKSSPWAISLKTYWKLGRNANC